MEKTQYKNETNHFLMMLAKQKMQNHNWFSDLKLINLTQYQRHIICRPTTTNENGHKTLPVLLITQCYCNLVKGQLKILIASSVMPLGVNALVPLYWVVVFLFNLIVLPGKNNYYLLLLLIIYIKVIIFHLLFTPKKIQFQNFFLQ